MPISPLHWGAPKLHHFKKSLILVNGELVRSPTLDANVQFMQEASQMKNS